MKGAKAKKISWARFLAFLRASVWWVQGKHLDLQLEKQNDPVRTEAEEALAKVIYETNIDPDCVSALIVRGGTAIQVKHDDAWEVFIGRTYDHAASEAIDWLVLQGDELGTKKTGEALRAKRGGMNRAERRAFNKRRKLHRGGRKPGERLH